MPLAQIQENVSIFYQDSGAPPNATTYTTIVVVHGLIVNGATFARLLPQASAHGLRIITMNNRDYAGSTPYTDTELAELISPDTEVQASAVRRWGGEVAAFVHFVCTTLQVPAATSGSGGVVLYAESLSSIAALAILGDPRTTSPELRAVLAPYLRKVVLYEPPGFVFGARPAGGLTFPVADAAVPVDAKAAAFLGWCSAHYAAVSALGDQTPEALKARDAAPLPTPSSFKGLSQNELAQLVDPGVVGRSALVIATAPEIRTTHTRRALFDADAVLPGVEVLVLWSERSPWITVWGAQVVQGFMSEEAESGKTKRRLELGKVDNANHFIHWEEPERLVQVLVNL
ncbi:alpha/beta hydrolase [Phanerochaete sordida]|uniref:Alpha/beta hydrolase n=1 Tax=Phanerochaete sordida TaxID=48140 RepID=A0A9P3G815_9APHY|nr:alpha/beta hydrolase [Phanerochaete sordida]